jgi:hypothetical protein
VASVSNLDEQSAKEADEMDVLTAAINLDPIRLTALREYAEQLVAEQQAS